MGAKTWMLVISDGDAREALAARPQLDREATLKLAEALFHGWKFEQIGDGDLGYTCPRGNDVHMGCFPGVTIIAAKEFGLDHPSKLHQRFITAAGNGNATLHAMHSAVDWFAYAVWSDGKLVRSLSVAPDNGIIEDIGTRLPFEEPYWAGQHPAVEDDEDDYPLPFHPLDMGEAALKDRFGYQLEGFIDPALLEPETIPLICYKRSRPAWWKFW